MEQSKLINTLSSGFWFRFFLLKSLPAAFFSGLRVQSLSTSSAVVRIRYSWFSKNPFRSIYFAVLGMAAEMSTGILALDAYPTPQTQDFYVGVVDASIFS